MHIVVELVNPLFFYESDISQESEIRKAIKLLAPLTNKIIPESATKLNIPAGTLTALAVQACARARAYSFKLSDVSLALSLSTNRSHYSLPLFPSQE